MSYKCNVLSLKEFNEKIQEFRNELNIPLKVVTPELVRKVIEYQKGFLLENIKFVSENNLIKIKDNDTGFIFTQTWAQLRVGYWYPNSRYGKDIALLFKYNLDPKKFKICSSCNTPKNKSDFFCSKNRKLGIVDKCKNCCSKEKKEYWEKHPDKKDERSKYDKEYRKDNIEKLSEVSTKYYKNNKEKMYYTAWKCGLKKYNITPEQFDDMVKNQNNKCAICGRDFSLNSVMSSGKVRKPAIDHDHKTGKIRQLLCHYCNCGLGSFDDNIEYLNKAIQYLKKYLGE